MASLEGEAHKPHILLFEIEDTGLGIDPKQRHSIFKAFEQADGTSTRRYGGTGLGLAITSQLVSLMGGEIDFTSSPGIGTCFQVHLRLRHAAVAPRDKLIETSDVKEGLSEFPAHVLLVEDNLVNQEVALAMLEVLGCRADVASDGQEALQSMAHTNYELILMDCHMPGMDGFTATRKLRQLEHTLGRSPVPVIALTADVQKGIETRCQTAGMDGYISKPFDLTQLRITLGEWLIST